MNMVDDDYVYDNKKKVIISRFFFNVAVQQIPGRIMIMYI